MSELIEEARRQVWHIHDKSRRERLIDDLADALEAAEAKLAAVEALFPGQTDPCPPRTCNHVDCEVLNAVSGRALGLPVGGETDGAR